MPGSNDVELHMIVSLINMFPHSVVVSLTEPDMLENMAFVVGAVLAGNMTKLGAGCMNQMMTWYLVSRVGYLVAYVLVGNEQYAMLRTLFYNLGVVVLLIVYVKAAGVLAES